MSMCVMCVCVCVQICFIKALFLSFPKWEFLYPACEQTLIQICVCVYNVVQYVFCMCVGWLY